ncbi:MAG: hypothetical protein EHM34_06555 [Nitrosopumilales archaeon]|nr:MAG: hypothetical protein EHM34_06555 [Nitrosopumilales archaeon]
MLITRLSNRAGVKVYGVHCSSRTFALTVYRKTRDKFLVSNLLGHSKVEITVVYLNINNEDMKDSFLAASPAYLLD